MTLAVRQGRTNHPLLKVHLSADGNGNNGTILEELARKALDALRRLRNIEPRFTSKENAGSADIIDLAAASSYAAVLESLSSGLAKLSRTREADALIRVVQNCSEDRNHGGLGISKTEPLTSQSQEKILFQLEAWLESINAAERSRRMPLALTEKPSGRRPMTMTQKIFAHHAIGHDDPNGLNIGDVTRVAVDWVIASEISWVGMNKTLKQLGDYNVWRNDRFWLAGDHVVDPRNYETELSKKLIKASEDAAKKFKLTDYKGMNYTIIHTEFVRSRAEPGILAIGSDSHTCSSGAVGCLAIGLGAADVAMPLITGETWFKIPEVINVRFYGEPGPGIGGKDTILYILGELKRNTVAAERIVEFTGPGLKHLSIDARFAICNMCTEFGAITGVFVPDETTKAYIDKRKQKNHKSAKTYFRPDEGAPYAETFEIDLSKVKSFFAVYPNPDDVVPVADKSGMKLDGCFIGACTTALEDLILAAMVLEVGLKRGLPRNAGKRHVVPGSLPVGQRLKELGLTKAFEDAGFVIGLPGCSFCVGMGSDQAKEGEVWISSQNRNFQNRMGKGSFGNLASAATVAASSFAMEVTDPSDLLAEVDQDLFDQYRQHSRKNNSVNSPNDGVNIDYVEPALRTSTTGSSSSGTTTNNDDTEKARDTTRPGLETPVIKSKIYRLGDYIDTDALAPAEFLVTVETDQELGEHCLQYTHPDFRSKVQTENQRIVVAGHAFGVGSSREEAVRALLGAGVQCVIARSFAFIYGRNQPNLGLLGIQIADDAFYEAAVAGAEIEVDVEARVAKVAGKEFKFPLTDIEISLLANKGITEAYKRFGSDVFSKLCGTDGAGAAGEEKSDDTVVGLGDEPGLLDELQW